ncbi:MAG: MATE family efflux transporter [Bacillota bacterium]|nr:MATE family efflux transporter [Bacillota bacterium]
MASPLEPGSEGAGAAEGEAAPARSVTLAQVLALAWPAIGEMVLVMMAIIADTAFVARLGAQALSAVALGGQVLFSLAFFLGGVGVGVTVLVARARGAGEVRQARRAAAEGVRLSVLLGGVLAAVAFGSAPAVYRWAGLGREVTALGQVYLRIAALGSFFFLPTLAINGALRGAGNTRAAFAATGLTNLVNIAGDYLLIFGIGPFPRLGVAGAAWALVLGEAVGLGAAVVFWRREEGIWPGRDLWRSDWRMAVLLARIGLPAGLETLILDGARSVTLFAVARLGAVAVAAHQVALSVESLAFMPGYGLAIAASVLMGESLGLGSEARARSAVRQAWRLAVGWMALLGGAFLLVPRLLLGLFTTQKEVVELGASCLFFAAFTEPFIGWAEVISGGLRGAGDTRPPLLITAAGAWLWRVPMTWLGVELWGWSLPALWAVVLVEWVVRALLTTAYYRTGRWTRSLAAPGGTG